MIPINYGRLDIIALLPTEEGGKSPGFVVTRHDADGGERAISPHFKTRLACHDWLKKSGLTRRGTGQPPEKPI